VADHDRRGGQADPERAEDHQRGVERVAGCRLLRIPGAFPGLGLAGPVCQADARVDALVDLGADALHESLGHGGVVIGAEILMRGYRGADLGVLILLHGLTVPLPGNTDNYYRRRA
jgi:hypothetical protein